MTALLAVAMIALAAGALAALASARAGALISAVAAALLGTVGVAAAVRGDTLVLELGGWLGFGDSALRVDGVAAIFLALSGVTAAAVALAYLQAPASRPVTALHGAVAFLCATAIGADNGFLFFLAWEALTVSIYLLASADASRAGGLGAGMLTGGLAKLGGGALLAAVALLAARTGTFDLATWRTEAPRLPPGTRDVLFILFTLAFGTKVGALPVQGAVPAGYAAAPRAGAATLSVALAAAFYGLWRFVLDILGPGRAWWGDALLALGALTAIAGIVYAIAQDDLRRFLGFSTVEHTGIALVGVGVALLGQDAGNRQLAAAGLLAATLHVVAHGLAKTLALLGVDRIELATGERTLDPLGGLARPLGATAGTLGIASLTLAAVPPLGGFVSEWFTFEALLQGFRVPTLLGQLLCALAAAVLALTAGLGLLAFAKLLGFSMLGPPRAPRETAPERPRSALAVLSLGAVVLALGTVAPWEVHLLGSGLRPVLGFDPADAAISHPLVLGPVFADFSVLAPTWLSLVLPAYALAAIAIVLAIRPPRARREPVWVTGSGPQLDAVQYRPSSYANPIRVVLRGPLGFSSRLAPGANGRLRLETRVVLAIDRFLYAPVQRVALVLAALVRRTQSGRLGAYLLYLLAVLVAVLSLVPLLR